MQLKILKNLGQPVALMTFIGVAFLVFDLNFYMMSTMIGSKDETCFVGANLTAANVIFSAGFSLLAGVFVAGLVALYKQRKPKKAAAGLSGLGFLIGFFTVFCVGCTFPVISLFGLSLGLNFFSDYDLIFKIISVLIMIIGLYILNRQLNGEGGSCKI